MEAESSGRQLTPLGKGGGAVEFEVFVAVEVTFLVEDPTGTDCDPRYRVVSQHDPLEATMSSIEYLSEEQFAVRGDLSAIFVSLDLSRSTWLVTSFSPGGGEKMSKHQVRCGDIAGLLVRFSQLLTKCKAPAGQPSRLVVIQEAGPDGFWIDRTLQNAGIESHIVHPASIATSRRRRCVKTDGIEGEALVRALLAYQVGEPRVCAMVKAPTPEAEDRRQISRERRPLTAERVEHVNRMYLLVPAQVYEANFLKPSRNSYRAKSRQVSVSPRYWKSCSGQVALSSRDTMTSGPRR